MYNLTLTPRHKEVINNAIEVVNLCYKGDWREVLNLLRLNSPDCHNAQSFIDEVSDKCRNEFQPYLKNNKDFLKNLEIVKVSVNKKDMCFSKKDMQILNKLMDNYSRLGSGQFDIWMEYLHTNCNIPAEEMRYSLYFNQKECFSMVQDFMDIKDFSFYGISSPKLGQEFKIAYDLNPSIQKISSLRERA